MKKAALPRMTSWMFLSGMTFLVFMTIMRFFFFFHFRPQGYPFLVNFNAFLLGLSFDFEIVCGIILFPFLIGSIHLEYNSKKWLRSVSILQLIVVLVVMVKLIDRLKRFEQVVKPLIFTLGAFFAVILIWLFVSKNCSPFENGVSRKIFKTYFFIVSLLIVFLYSLDWEYYDYLHQRMSRDIWNYTSDIKISAGMVWQSYPVITILLFIIITVALLYGLAIYWFKRMAKKKIDGSRSTWKFTGVTFALLLIAGIFGKINFYSLKLNDELKWSDAFSFQDNFKGNLALNPVLSFLTSLQVGSSSYDLKKVKEFYPLMVSTLDIKNPDSVHLNYDRTYQTPHTNETPNVVLVICESFAAYKSSMWGNPLNTTPHINELCKQGIFFDRCFSPGYGTARGVFATITGIPDVEYPNMSTNNPAFVNQNTIINDYKGYEKFYFFGGSTDFEHIGAVINNNISGIKIYQEKDFKSKKINVWGMSDKDLFLDANDTLKEQSKPFFAIIQTSNNHRPFTIPDEDKKEIKLENYPLDTLKKYGFESNEELNSFRYSDFCFKKFIDAAKKENYFKNTIFVFVGDHGVPGTPPSTFPLAWDIDFLCYNHIPLLFYAPSLLTPQRIHRTVSQVDVLPSVSALAKISYTNRTMGMNLFDSTQSNTRMNNARFLFNSNLRVVSVVNDQYVYTLNLASGKEDFRSSKDDLPLPQTAAVEEDRKEIKTMADAYFETAKYMLSHNSRKQ